MVLPDSKPRTFQRIPSITPKPEELSAYAGEYRSDELQATYKFTAKDGKLDLTVGWQEAKTLEPSVRDEFIDPSGRVMVFRRDAAGRVTGMDLFAGRVRNIRFQRVVP